VVIGERPAFFLTIALLVAALATIAIFSVTEPGYLWLLAFVPFGALLVQPVIRAMNDLEYRNRFVDAINTRAICLAAVMLIVFAYLRLGT